MAIAEITGEVVRGDGYGKKLGFPTLNLESKMPEALRKLALGVYAGLAAVEGKRHRAAIVVGPELPNGLPKIEAHLLDFTGDLYGKEATLSLGKFLRPFAKFETEVELITQIKKDVATVRADNSGASVSK